MLANHKNYRLDSFYEISFSWCCSISTCLPQRLVWNTVVMQCYSINLPHELVMCGLALLAATWKMLDQLQEQICRAADFSFAAFIESLADRQNDANLSVFYRCYFGRCSFELVKLVRLSYTRGRSTCILID